MLSALLTLIGTYAGRLLAMQYDPPRASISAWAQHLMSQFGRDTGREGNDPFYKGLTLPRNLLAN